MDIEELLDDESVRIMVIEDAANAEVLLRPGGALAAILVKAFDEAKDGLNALVHADPTDAKGIRDLQWVVTRYDSIVGWIKEILTEGEMMQADMSAEESESLHRLLRGEPMEKDA